MRSRRQRQGLWMATRISCLALCGFALQSAPALGAAPAPGWAVTVRTFPTVLVPGTRAVISVDIYNVGAAPSNGPVSVTDELPAALGGATLSASAPAFGPGEIKRVQLEVAVPAGASGTAVNHVSVTGGGAASAASVAEPISFGSTMPGFGLSGSDGWFSNADGTFDTQAGSHPYEASFSFDFNNYWTESESGLRNSGGDVRNLDVNLPTGLIGDPNAVSQCTRQQLDHYSACPPASQVGVASIGIAETRLPTTLTNAPIYNMVPPPGVPAEFAFDILGVNAFLDAAVRTGGDDGITVHVRNIVQGRSIVYSSVTFWGIPSDPSHDAQRSSVVDGCEEGCSVGSDPYPFLTLPTSCAGPQEFRVHANTWQDVNVTADASFLSHDSFGTATGFTGCDHLSFSPTIAVAPDTSQADTPAGLSVDVKVPQEGLTNAEALAASNIQNTKVVLPEGLVINPGQAAGLVACQAAESGVGGEGPPTCPAASKVGTDQIATPLLPDKLEGNVYVLQSNPPNLQLLVAASGDGVNLKLVGDVHLDEATGQLTTTFSGTPELPFTDFKLSFSGGAQAALATPTGCGDYTTNSDFTPWSAPSIADIFATSSFAIDSGPHGSACASPLPFAPTLTAGATTDQAGGYTNFSLLLQREDGEQRISTLSFKTPEGLLGMISKVPLCGEPAAAQGTCSSASQIGHTVVAAGPGPDPLVIPEPGQAAAPIYLTGGYKGAPYGLSIAVPVIAGPFNLGTVVVRASISVDPSTTQLTVTTDPLPSILDGIPTDLRTVNAVIDRPGFMFNPTDCAPMSFSGRATSTEGTVAAISSHFQMGSCQSLKFAPIFKVSTAGRSSRRNGASLDAKIQYPTAALGADQASSQANIASVKVDLPKQLPARLTTLQKACTAAQFNANPAGCPKASIVGHATALTPVLPVPLTGPAYFVSHGGEAFPSLIVVLQGYGVTVDLEGTTFIDSKTSITSSTFKQVPDVPITSFDLTLPEGPFSALAANLPAKAKGSFCGQALVMPTAFVAHNGATIHQSTKLTVSGCAKAIHKRSQTHKHKHTRPAGRRRRA